MDNRQSEYDAKIMSTQMNLRKFYNACVEIMAKGQAGELPMEDCELEFIALDQVWAKSIVDDLSPKSRIIT